MSSDTEKKKYEIDGEAATEVQNRLANAEYALEILHDRSHDRLEKLLNGITSHYRIVKNRSVLEKVHAGCKNPHDELLKNSDAAGTIISSFKDGEIDLQVFSIDINQAELLSRSKRELAALIFQAIGLTAPTEPTATIPSVQDNPTKK